MEGFGGIGKENVSNVPKDTNSEKNLNIILENFTQSKEPLVVDKEVRKRLNERFNINSKLKIPMFFQDENNYVEALKWTKETKEKILNILGVYKPIDDTGIIYYHPEVSKNIKKGFLTISHENIHAIIGGMINNKELSEAITEYFTRKITLEWNIIENREDIFNKRDTYLHECSKMLIPLMVEHKLDREKINEELEEVILGCGLSRLKNSINEEKKNKAEETLKNFLSKYNTITQAQYDNYLQGIQNEIVKKFEQGDVTDKESELLCTIHKYKEKKELLKDNKNDILKMRI